jgi:hypothetical protein
MDFELKVYEMEGNTWEEVESFKFDNEVEAFEAFIKRLDGYTVSITNDLLGYNGLGYKAFGKYNDGTDFGVHLVVN